MLTVVQHVPAGDQPTRSDTPTTDLDEICRLAAQQMLAVALEAERRAYLDAHAHVTDDRGHRVVVGNGHQPARDIVTGAGPIEVRKPRVHDPREGHRFASAILPAYMRKSAKVTEVLPLLYLRGLSTGDFAPALTEFFGTDAGLSSSTIQRLTVDWQAEHEVWSTRSLAEVDYVYVWADGVHVNVRLPDADGDADTLCLLVLVGVRSDGTKELIAVSDGFREAADSWADLLRDLTDRGMAEPVLAVGDGALGLWKAIRDVWPTTRHQRCWVHRIANVLAALPKRLHPRAKELLRGIWDAKNRAAAVDAAATFATEFAKYPKAVAKITDDLDELLAFYDFPAEHWKHLRTTNPIESTFATVRLRQRVTKGPGSRAAGIAMAFKLLLAAQQRWRRINGHELVALVRAGATFVDGELQERADGQREAEEVPTAA
ncbi:IS256 family transposase [Mycolicibacterium hippocampi]|uniref:IS256 family transposase n=1 Tax=Mycolicibacterium hippocampi TaxID=659824 RepID=UPI003513BA7A